jgi:CRP/FNR family transcriptional regulator
MQESVETLKFPLELKEYIRTCNLSHQTISFAADEHLYLQEDEDDSLFILTKGHVEIFALSDKGGETILDILGPGALCGEGAAFDRQPRATSARALSAGEAISVSARQIVAAMPQHPKLAKLLVKTIAVKQRVLVERLRQISQHSSDERVLHLLKKLCSNSDGVPVSITHEKMARLIGLTRVTVTRSIRKLIESGQISTHSRKIYIKPNLL